MKKAQFLLLLFILTITHESFASSSDSNNTLVIHADQGKFTINKNIYGQFSEHLGYGIGGGIWVGLDSNIPNIRGMRKDVIEALRKIKVPALRWPGGCYASIYHWQDGIGPLEKRKPTLNVYSAGNIDKNEFGTHEFMDFCELIGAEPVIVGNMEAGTVHEMSQWVEYITADQGPMAELRKKNGREKPWDLQYFGVGNENQWTGGAMTPEYYCNEYRKYWSFLFDFHQENMSNFGKRMKAIANGPIGDDWNWTETLMKNISPYMWGMGFHHYIVAGESRSATNFGEEQWYTLLNNASKQMDELITKHCEIMDKYDPGKNIALVVDEWGAWHDTTPGVPKRFFQHQSTIRDGLVAGIILNSFNRHCDRIRMANIAQMVNVVQALILTKDEKMLLTPTYHVYDMYKVHRDALLLPFDLKCEDYRFGDQSMPGLSVSVSKDTVGKIHVSVCNSNHIRAAKLECKIEGANVTKVSGRVLTADKMTSHNNFTDPNIVRPVDIDAIGVKNGFVSIVLPARSVTVLELE